MRGRRKSEVCVAAGKKEKVKERSCLIGPLACGKKKLCREKREVGGRRRGRRTVCVEEKRASGRARGKASSIQGRKATRPS